MITQDELEKLKPGDVVYYVNGLMIRYIKAVQIREINHDAIFFKDSTYCKKNDIDAFVNIEDAKNAAISHNESAIKEMQSAIENIRSM